MFNLKFSKSTITKIVIMLGFTTLITACSSRFDVAPVESITNGSTSGTYSTSSNVVSTNPVTSVAPQTVTVANTYTEVTPQPVITSQPKNIAHTVINSNSCTTHLDYPIPRIGKTANYLEITPGSYPNATYKVVSGDTLTMLSYISGLEIDEIRKVNNISGNNIKVGQTIVFRDCTKAQTVVKSTSTKQVTQQVTAIQPSTASKSVSSIVSKPQTEINKKAEVNAPPVSTNQTVQITPNLPTPKSKVVIDSSPNTTTQKPNKVVSGWSWPANGPVISQFSNANAGTRGIDIAGRLNDPVYAVSSGVVAYAGNELQGYGNLIIIKHDNNYISTYSHNNVMLVKKGDSVVSGQQIAKMGSTGTNRIMLHFEIRRNKVAIDPLTVLPRK